MGVVVRALVGLALALMATRAAVAILQRAMLASLALMVVMVTIGAVLGATAAFAAITIVATISSTASAGGILVRATAPLVGTIAGAVGGPLLLFLVKKSFDGAVLDVHSKVLREGGTNWVKVFPDLFVGLGILLLVRGREGHEDSLCKLESIRLGELGTEQSTLKEGE
jgi:hypothetical protein